MRVKFLGESDPCALLNGKIYDVQSVENGWYRIIDETGSDVDDVIPGYLYPPEAFEVVDDAT